MCTRKLPQWERRSNFFTQWKARAWTEITFVTRFIYFFDAECITVTRTAINCLWCLMWFVWIIFCLIVRTMLWSQTGTFETKKVHTFSRTVFNMMEMCRTPWFSSTELKNVRHKTSYASFSAVIFWRLCVLFQKSYKKKVAVIFLCRSSFRPHRCQTGLFMGVRRSDNFLTSIPQGLPDVQVGLIDCLFVCGSSKKDLTMWLKTDKRTTQTNSVIEKSLEITINVGKAVKAWKYLNKAEIFCFWFIYVGRLCQEAFEQQIPWQPEAAFDKSTDVVDDKAFILNNKKTICIFWSVNITSKFHNNDQHKHPRATNGISRRTGNLIYF